MLRIWLAAAVATSIAASGLVTAGSASATIPTTSAALISSQTAAPFRVLSANTFVGVPKGYDLTVPAKPQLICEPGGICGTVEYFESYAPVYGPPYSPGFKSEGYNQATVVHESDGVNYVEGCVGGLVGSAALAFMSDGTSAVFYGPESEYYAQCVIGGAINEITGWFNG
jgi:hypothetical protein